MSGRPISAGPAGRVTGARDAMSDALCRVELFDRSGAAAAEFAMVAPVFALIFAGMIDVGFVLYTKFGLNGSVSAAANYALINSSNVSSTGGTTLASNLASIVASGHASNWANASVVVNNGPSASISGGTVTTGGTAANADSCYCPTGTSGTISWGSATTCGATCSNGSVAGKFIVVTANRAFSPMFASYGIVSNGTISASTVVQTQ